MIKRTTIAGALLLFIFTFTLIGCGSQQSAIRGTWERVTPTEQLGIFSFFAFVEQIEFLENGTFVLPKIMNTSGSYSFPQSDRISFQGPQGTATYKYVVNGDRLTFEADGKTIEYRRTK
ncbi:MAG: hypothetical protein B6D41_08280 [Chloroflexi bacterium UTCFX4]|jgi:hypothetical protein|nr:MAG: hypothetical protein B6D41_08280 [Chloroflexi bacterium UTCFX4]